MSLAIAQHKSFFGARGTPGSVTLSSAPTAGRLLIAFVSVNIVLSSLTISSNWTQFAVASTPNENSVITVGLYRYVQAGDTAALPAFCTAGFTYWGACVYEISGVSGSWATDFQTQVEYYSTGALLAPEVAASQPNCLALAGWSSYNGSSTVTVPSGWTSDEDVTNSSLYGSIGCCSQTLATTGTKVTAPITAPASPNGIIVVVLKPSATSVRPYIRQKVMAQTNSTLPTIQFHGQPVIGNLLIAVLFFKSTGISAPTFANAGWTQFGSQISGSNYYALYFYRYVQAGDTVTAPAIITSSVSYTAQIVAEVGGVSGSFAGDIASQKDARQATGTSMTTTADTAVANCLVLLFVGNYNSNAALGYSAPFGFIAELWGSTLFGASLLLESLPNSGDSVSCTLTGLSSESTCYLQMIIAATGTVAVTAPSFVVLIT